MGAYAGFVATSLVWSGVASSDEGQWMTVNDEGEVTRVFGRILPEKFTGAYFFEGAPADEYLDFALWGVLVER